MAFDWLYETRFPALRETDDPVIGARPRPAGYGAAGERQKRRSSVASDEIAYDENDTVPVSTVRAE